MRTLKIYLTNKQYQKIREIAYKKTTTLSQVIRWCIDLYPTAKQPTEKEVFMKKLEEIVKESKKNKKTKEPEWLF